MPRGRIGVAGLGSRKECPVWKIEIDPAIAVVVERGDTGRQRLDEVAPTTAPVGVDEADAGSLRGVDEPDRRGVGFQRRRGVCRWSRLTTAEDQNQDHDDQREAMQRR